jgi:hypothetical protein
LKGKKFTIITTTGAPAGDEYVTLELIEVFPKLLAKFTGMEYEPGFVFFG